MSETTPLVTKSEKIQFDNVEIGSGYSASERAKNSIRRLHGSLSRVVESHMGRIGFLGSMAIASNSLTGPAMLNLPATFQRAGLIPTTCTVIFVCILSAVGSLHLANTISKAPGNGNFKKEVSTVFCGRKAYQFIAFEKKKLTTMLLENRLNSAKSFNFSGAKSGSLLLKFYSSAALLVSMYPPS
jgi:hypothetical protein